MIKINPQRIKRHLRKALKLLIFGGIAGNGRKKNMHLLASREKDIELSILFVNDKRIREINLQYRKKDKVTDVISFPQFEDYKYLADRKHRTPLSLGDIVLNLQQTKRQARQNKISFYDEVSRLLVHGLLHLLGYDHEKNAYHAKKMADTESRLLALIIHRGVPAGKVDNSPNIY